MTNPSDISALIGEIDELFEKSTDTPWIQGNNGFGDAGIWGGDDVQIVGAPMSKRGDLEDKNNTLFITALVNAWPTLRDTLRKEPVEGDIFSETLRQNYETANIRAARMTPRGKIARVIADQNVAQGSYLDPFKTAEAVLEAIPHPAPALSREKVAELIDGDIKAATLPGEDLHDDDHARNYVSRIAARRALALVTPATAWREISTAPKDGTHILAILQGIHPLSHEPYVPSVVFWSKRSGGWLAEEDEDGEYICGFEPTHWMPLPPVPESKP